MTTLTHYFDGSSSSSGGGTVDDIARAQSSNNATQLSNIQTDLPPLETQDVLNKSHIADAGIHLTATQKTSWDAKADKIDSSSWNATTGTLTINHTDSSQTVANVGVPNVLQGVTYDDVTNTFTFTFVDTSVIAVDASDLFDSTSFNAVAKDDTLKTLTFTRLDTGTEVVDLSSWFVDKDLKSLTQVEIDALDDIISAGYVTIYNKDLKVLQDWDVASTSWVSKPSSDDYVIDDTGAVDGDGASFVDDGAGGLKIAKGASSVATHAISGSVHIVDFGNNIVRMSGRSSGVNFVNLPITLSAVIDAGVTVENDNSYREVHLSSATGTRLSFFRNGGTGSAFRWYIMGIRQ